MGTLLDQFTGGLSADVPNGQSLGVLCDLFPYFINVICQFYTCLPATFSFSRIFTVLTGVYSEHGQNNLSIRCANVRSSVAAFF